MGFNEMLYWLRMFAEFVKAVFLFCRDVIDFLAAVINVVCQMPGIVISGIVHAFPFALAFGALISVGQLAVFGWRKLAEYRARPRPQEVATPAIDAVTVSGS